MKAKIFTLLCLGALSLAACGRSGSSGSGTLDKTLNGGKEIASLSSAEVHEGYLELLQRVNPNIEGQIKTPAGKKRLVDSLLEQELLYQESLKRGVDRLPQVQEKAALYQRVIYGQALVDEEINKKSKDYYDTNKDKEFSRVKVAHILVRPKPPEVPKGGKTPPPKDNTANEAAALKRAQEAKAKLASGSAWDEIVMTYSDDVATKSKGGELGYISRGDRRIGRLDWNELVEQAFSMKIGETSDPIKAKDGYHIITVQELPSIAPYEEVQNSIKFKLRSQVKNEVLAGLTKGQKTEYKDPELTELSTPKAPAPPPAQLSEQPAASPAAKPQPISKPVVQNPPAKKPDK